MLNVTFLFEHYLVHVRIWPAILSYHVLDPISSDSHSVLLHVHEERNRGTIR